MLFQDIYFDFDEEGNFLSEPRLLRAVDIRSAGFELEHREHRLNRFTLPAIAIVRRIKNVKHDPYNEDGSPATVWTTIVHPHVEFHGQTVLIVGFEYPNMGFAGLAMPAYRNCEPLDLPAERIWHEAENRHSRDFADLPRQVIRLV